MKGIVNTRGATASELAAVAAEAETALSTAQSAATDAANALTAAQNAQTAADSALDLITTINSTIGSVPSQNGTLTYTGSAQSPSWNSYDSEKLTIGGTTSATDAGTYYATFTPTDEYVWSDGTQDTVSVAWTIGRASVSVPSQSGTLTYTGAEQSPTWSNYDSTQLTIGGTTSGTDAGTYTATFTPTSNYQWSDGTYSAVSVTWTISKASGSATLSATSVTLSISSLTSTVTVSGSYDGTVSASSSNTSVATVSVSGSTITITWTGTGSATITVSIAAGTNYSSVSGLAVAVTCSGPSTTLSSNSAATIQAAAEVGVAANYWSVGDTIGIALSGAVGSLTLSGTYYAFIIGFDHNSTYEGSNTIHFQFGKTSDGTDIAFVDSYYGSYDSSAEYFCMNFGGSNTNSGGWSSSDMRTSICADFLSAMPSSWQSVISKCTKYTDNTGGGNGSTSSYVTSTSDSIWLLAEYEVQGANSYANSYETNKQAQYEYYSNGNSKIKYKHSDTSTACGWWLRSPFASLSTYFCVVSPSGSANGNFSRYSLGFAPGFKVA